MLDKSMNLKEMIYYKPSDDDMLELPLDALVYIKVFATSSSEEDNANFIRHLTANQIQEDLFEPEKTTFYSFNSPDKTRYVSIFEMLSKISYYEISDHLMEILESYNHDCDVVCDFFTHDNHLHRLSDLAGEIKLDDLY